MEKQKQRGEVKFFSPIKKFGFIIHQQQQTIQEIFFHQEGINQKSQIPQKGDQVEYTLGTRKGKTIAENIKVIK